MAATDITARNDLSPGLDFVQTGPFIFKTKKIDFAAETALGGQFTHNIIPIAVGEALAGFDVIVQTTIVSASGTITWQIGATTWSEIVTASGYVAGMVTNYRAQAAQVTAEKVDQGLALAYAPVTADTLDMDVNTDDIDSGVIFVVARLYRNLDSILG